VADVCPDHQLASLRASLIELEGSKQSLFPKNRPPSSGMVRIQRVTPIFVFFGLLQESLSFLHYLPAES
jgi:hypothetical protein